MNYCGYYFKISSQANVFFFHHIGNGQGNIMDFTIEYPISKGEVYSNILNGNCCFGKESVFLKKASYPLE